MAELSSESLLASINALTATLSGQQEQIPELKASAEKSVAELNTFYLMWAGALIFLMQAGFATLSAGSIRAKNVKNILLKNLLDACIGAFAWYLLGYGFAYDIDDNTNPFIGTGPSHFALSGHKDWDGKENKGYDWIMWYFQYAFCAAAATIVSGAVAERCQLMAYLVYSFCISGFVYPVVVHWVWDGSGFLSAFNKDHIMSGVIDFAGSGVVHMTGGFAALVGAKILGPRTGRFERPGDFDGHSTPLQLIGTFLLWFGWYGFNPGSTLVIHGYAHTMARTAVTTTLSAAMGGLTGLLVKRCLPEKLGGSGLYDIGHTCNSLLGALVGITAGCATVHPWAAIIIGIISAFVYHAASCMMRKLHIDDPLDAFAVHGACGMWGVLATGLFTAKEYSYAPHEDSDLFKEIGGYDAGLFMEGTHGSLFATHVVSIIIEVAWVVTMSAIMFGLLKAAKIFRVPPEDEDIGLDNSKHGGSAYTHDMQMTPNEMAAFNVAMGDTSKPEATTRA
jgi:Amt family ammonium transporter